MASAPHWPTTKVCSLASAGDAAIALVSFWVVATIFRNRAWVLEPSGVQVALFTLTGVMVAVTGEWIATEALGWWAYAEQMPTLPLLGTGLLPLFQWMILPLLVVWFVQHQLT